MKSQIELSNDIVSGMKHIWFALSLVAVSVVVWAKVSGQVMEEPEITSQLKKKKKKKKLKKKSAAKTDFPVLNKPKEVRPVASVKKM